MCQRVRHLDPALHVQLAAALHFHLAVHNHVPEDFALILRVLRDTGTRPSNVCRVAAVHLDWENGGWWFSEENAVEGKVHKTFEKTGEGLFVPVSEEVMEVCRQLAERYPEGPLFRTKEGEPWNSDKIAQRFDYYKKKLVKAGVPMPKNYFAYCYRHTRLTELLMDGESATLKNIGVFYKLTNSRVTARALFDVLRDFPDAVHVLEDVETLFADKDSSGVLRSALWGQVGPDGKQERTVCWLSAKEPAEFVFTGGIIIISNCRLDDLPQLRALGTRIPVVQYQPSNKEVAALMRVIAAKGHVHGTHTLTPEKCLEVAEAIIERSARLGRNLDLRLLVNTFQDRLQFENGAAETHWVDLLESRLRERAVVSGVGAPREMEVLRRIVDLPAAERLDVWTKETGMSRATLYRRLGELDAAESHVSRSHGERDGTQSA